MGLRLEEGLREKLIVYATELQRWNATVNLTALSGAELLRRLVVEPVWIGRELEMAESLLDVGSGNGCPGIALSVTREFDRVHLVEARGRRAAFLRYVIQKLGLRGVSVSRSRLEDSVRELGRVKWVTLQGVRPSSTIHAALKSCSDVTTRVVWITSSGSPPSVGAKRVSVPGGSQTEAWVYSLDQF